MYNITLIPGDGIGPEITDAAVKVIDASGIKIKWEIVNAGEAVFQQQGELIPKNVFDSIRKNKVALKGPITTPIGEGFRSLNVTLREEFNLYANVRPAKTLPGVDTHYKNVDIIVVRENTEDLYAGIEHMVGDDAAESIKIITRKASERIVRFAFELAKSEKRKKVTLVHKANIMKLTDGLFLECGRRIAAQYPDIEFEDRIVDNICAQLIKKPEIYDVLVLPNLYGDIISDLCAGLVGGLGVVGGSNIGDDISIFEPVHGSVPKYAGMNRANPTAVILSGILMLKHLGEHQAADRIVKGTYRVLEEGRFVTRDLGGTATTSEMGEAIAEVVSKL